MTEPGDSPDPLLAEQIAYYRAMAPLYADEALAVMPETLLAAVDALEVSGHVLELACGPGIWTERLAARATSVTAVDAAPEMLARARARVPQGRVRFVQADLFEFAPERRYNLVFFGFWLSHVPPDRFESFWDLVGHCLEPGGRVFFCDDAHRSPEELVEGAASATVERRLPDGTSYRAVKVPYEPVELEQRLRRLGWDMTVHAGEGPFYWGSGTRAFPAAP